MLTMPKGGTSLQERPTTVSVVNGNYATYDISYTYTQSPKCQECRSGIERCTSWNQELTRGDGGSLPNIECLFFK